MKRIFLFRHGATALNLEKRYMGRTDAPLCETGVLQAKAVNASSLPIFDDIFVSPYIRCQQTASILFPGRAFTTVQDLRECDFGMFEGLTANELSTSPQYAAWLASNCQGPIPGGEDTIAFKQRAGNAVLRIAQAMNSCQTVAIVTHGGCIMAALERYALPRRDFYDYYVDNCGYVSCTFNNGVFTVNSGEFVR